MDFIVKKFEELNTFELYEILKVRSQVFVVELKMNCQDMDGVDYSCYHLYLKEKEKIIAYMRMYFENKDSKCIHIGRVLTVERGNGYAKALMEKAIDYAQNVLFCNKICLNSQKQAVGFYEKMGFKATSGEFIEENVIHISMELVL
ncbi:MAG: GNAT family N-acetyltransferase [Acutalibacteraceae bacterium]|nr:GNAT family N-acetyltransferase [Acutalibacteraceae bacterium]